MALPQGAFVLVCRAPLGAPHLDRQPQALGTQGAEGPGAVASTTGNLSQLGVGPVLRYN